MLEAAFQRKLIEELESRYPTAIIVKSAAGYLRSFPDLIILYNDKWATFDTKRDGLSDRQPNQGYYIKRLGSMSFAAFVYPSNIEEVLHELERHFHP